MGEMKAARGGEHGETKRKSSFLGRWVKRLFVLAILGFAALGYGFWKHPGPDGEPQKKLPWDDPESFKRYSIDVLTWAKEEGSKVAATAKERFDKIEWTRESQALYDKAVALLSGDERAPAPSSAEAPAAAGPAAPEKPAPPPAPETHAAAPKAPAPGPSDPVAGPGGPAKPGYYDAYKSGYTAYRDGLIHFRDARPGSSKDRGVEIKAALAKFQEASARFQEAAGLRENDPRLDELIREVNQYIFECRKQLKAASL